MTMNSRMYQRSGRLNRVVSVDEAELGLEKGGWWSVGHFERRFVVELDARATGVEDSPKVFVR
jgi:hypothetical protein